MQAKYLIHLETSAGIRPFLESIQTYGSTGGFGWVTETTDSAIGNEVTLIQIPFD